MEYTRFIGWDVHGETVVIAEALPGRAPARDVGTIPNTEEAVLRWLRKQPAWGTLVIAYEAGPTGFGLARLCHRQGIACEVIAPGLVPVRPTDRVKTDRRDARKIAVDLRAGQLTPIHLPTPVEEAFRDLVRAREAVVYDRRRVRQRLQSALLRWGIRRPERFLAWSPRWRTWIRRVHPEPDPRGEVWNELLSQLEELDDRVTRIERAIKAAIPHHPQAPLLIAFQALRGINWVTSATIVAEFGALTQFSHPRAVMSSVGVVPTEVSSGPTQRRGPITKTGNAHVRRVLIEAAHSYRYPPTRRGRSAQRVGAAPAAWQTALKTIDWRAQQRLHARLRRLTAKRGRAPAVTAVARELCGYLWEIAVWVHAQTASEEEFTPISS